MPHIHSQRDKYITADSNSVYDNACQPRLLLLPTDDPDYAANLCRAHAGEMERGTTMASLKTADSLHDFMSPADGWDGDEYKVGTFKADIIYRTSGDFAVVYYENGNQQSVDGKMFDAYPTLDAAHEGAERTIDGWTRAQRGAYPVGSLKTAISNDESFAKDIINELGDRSDDSGFTVHDHIGDAPTSGYMVSIDKGHEHVVDARGVTPQQIIDFIDRYQSELSSYNRYFGGWIENGLLYLDVSEHTNDIGEAARVASANNQISIFDFSTFRSIPTAEAMAMAGITGKRHAANVNKGAPLYLEWYAKGREGWSSGESRIPVLVESVGDAIEELNPEVGDSSSIEIMQGWADGWDWANDTSVVEQFPGMPGPGPRLAVNVMRRAAGLEDLPDEHFKVMGINDASDLGFI